jgi:hypothetical protein
VFRLALRQTEGLISSCIAGVNPAGKLIAQAFDHIAMPLDLGLSQTLA